MDHPRRPLAKAALVRDNDSLGYTRFDLVALAAVAAPRAVPLAAFASAGGTTRLARR